MRRLVRPLLGCTLVALLAIILAAAPASPTPKTLKDFKGATGYTVVRVVDGDTVVVRIGGKNIKVRLIGVDTPECVDPRKPVQFFAREASAFTRQLLKGRKVFLEYDQQKTDRYGRTLAYLYRSGDGLLINGAIIRQGYGHAYTRFPFRYLENFRKAERQAREHQRGLWGSPAKIGKPAAPEKADPAGVVYVTRTGKKYHRSGCRYLKRSKIALSLARAKKGYGPCAVCKPPE